MEGLGGAAGSRVGIDLARHVDLARLAGDIQYTAVLEFVLRAHLPMGDLRVLCDVARRLDVIYPRMIRTLEWLELRFVAESADELIDRVRTVLIGSGVNVTVVEAITEAAARRGGPAVATAAARRSLRESYQQNQETLRQLELDTRPPCSTMEHTATGAIQAAASAGVTAAGAVTGILPLLAAGLMGEIAYHGPVSAAILGTVVNWVTG
jgi:hypothetical protein